MPPVPPSASALRRAKQRAAVATATLPVVMLSALAIAQPAAAEQPHTSPAKQLAGRTAAQVPAAKRASASTIPAGAVSSLIPAGQVTQVLPASISVTYTVKSGDTVSAIAARHGLSVTAVLNLNHLRSNSIIYPGQKLKLSGTITAPTASTPSRSAAPAATSTYTIRPGDTVSAIASRHGLSVASVLRLNNLSASSIIYPGGKLKLSGTAASPAPAPVRSSTPVAPASTSSAGGNYTIRSGDTLSSIAAAHHVSLSSLMAANKLNLSSIIYAGRKLSIPGAAAAVATAPQQQQVPSTFLSYSYPEAVVAQANANKRALMAAPVPSPAQMKQIVATTASTMGVDPSLAMAFALQESSFNQQAVSPANAIGTMQIIPSSGEWASQLVGRHLNLLNPYDNVTAGVAIIRTLVATSSSTKNAIAGYYQGQTSVAQYGMFADTKNYVVSILANQKLFK